MRPSGTPISMHFLLWALDFMCLVRFPARREAARSYGSNYCDVMLTTPVTSRDIMGTRHRLHNASPPLRCRGAKQRHPASRNTATATHEERAECLFMSVFDREVDREKRGKTCRKSSTPCPPG